MHNSLNNLISIQKEIQHINHNTKIIAVSKTFSIDKIKPIIDHGHIDFGENKVQEAVKKWPALLEVYHNVQLHLIGALQSNKDKQAVKLFDVIETVDRPTLAGALARNMDALGRRPECFVQVNTGEEAQKAGVLPREADLFIQSCREEFELPVTGLMCIPPAQEEPSPHFYFLKKIAQRNGLKKLSMGMSSDYKVAVTFGATHVRVGTGIFGARQQFG